LDGDFKIEWQIAEMKLAAQLRTGAAREGVGQSNAAMIKFLNLLVTGPSASSGAG